MEKFEPEKLRFSDSAISHFSSMLEISKGSSAENKIASTCLSFSIGFDGKFMILKQSYYQI